MNSPEQRKAIYGFICNELFTEGNIGIIAGGGGINELERQTLATWWCARIVQDIDLVELVAMVEYAFGGTFPYDHECDLPDVTLGELAATVLTH